MCPGKNGAMENWGLVHYDRPSLLVEPPAQGGEGETTALSDHHIHVMGVVAHEMAHQWFGNLVTLRWWDEAWMQEGLACYCSSLAQDALEPTSHAWARGLATRTQMVMREDVGGKSRPMADRVTSRADIHSMFGQVAYSKVVTII